MPAQSSAATQPEPEAPAGPSRPAAALANALAHSAFEDALALVLGTLFVSFGVAMYAQAGLLTGGTAGLAFLLHYATGASFGLVFFVKTCRSIT